LQGLARIFPRHADGCQFAQLLIDQGQQLLCRRGIALLHASQDLCDVGHDA